MNESTLNHDISNDTMNATVRPLLVELFTEELPPKALQKLGLAFSKGMHDGLATYGLLASQCEVVTFATPRRLAVRLTRVMSQAPQQAFVEKLMPVKIGLDANGGATPALVKKLASKGWEGIDVNTLARESDGKQDYLVMRGDAPGATLTDVLESVIESSLAGLPIPKMMKYQLADGITSVKFVRPAHALIVLFGQDIIPATILGLQAGRVTHGHRFLHPGAIVITDATSYEHQVAAEGHVLASFDARRDEIARQLKIESDRLGTTLSTDPAVAELLNEVTALVESPKVYVGAFEARFLAVPQECLILTMRLNQKYFPLFDRSSGKLTHQFLIVSNMPTDHPEAIIQGNERVVRPRLADAEFFYQTDRKLPLSARVAALGSIVYHNKLGSQLQRVDRVRQISAWIAHALNVDPTTPDRAAMLAKADLTTNMVGEFPELQGIMGAYYALGDGESQEVVDALQTQYRIRFDTAIQRQQLTAAILFMADRAETLVGIWGIGLAPTGERDPFGLRRAALGILSVFEQLTAGGLLRIKEAGPITLEGLLQAAAQSFAADTLATDTVTEVNAFIIERLRNTLIQQYDRNAVEAVLALSPPLHQIHARVKAVTAFMQLPAASSLAAANKRISNLLKKAEETTTAINPALLTDAAEISLATIVGELQPIATQQVLNGDYEAAMQTLAQARTPVDAFFTEVMVMADDVSIRNNRLALLANLHGLMNQVADISRLAT